MQFSYKALSCDGKLSTGQAEAHDAVDLENKLKTRNLELIRCHTRHRPLFLKRNTVAPRELIHFCFHLEHLTRAGIPILDGLKDLRDTTENPGFRQIVSDVIGDIENGQSISQAMAAHPNAFDAIFVSLIRAGEESGQLPATLNNLSETLKWEDEIAAQTRKLLLYPSFVASIVVGATIFLMLYMVPQLKVFLNSAGQPLPFQTRLLFWVSESIAESWAYFLASALGGGLTFKAILHSSTTFQRRIDAFKLTLPILGPTLAKIELSRFANTFAMLYGAGISVLEAIAITREVVGNLAIQHGLDAVERSIREGRNIAGAFAETGLFPPLVIRMLQIGESTGGLDSVLLNISYFYTRDVKESIGRLQAMIEPTLTVVMGGLLGWIMLALIGPIYDVIGQVKL